ncbi:MAG: SMP-30/gluconolactonase/LRE family protein [Acidobacteria bacterium]|nr:SMP-30/gluconolactonase/LRE family protein [Acidobacteriota bacterium]
MRTNDYSVEIVAPLSCQIGENPLWHPEAATLFFLDIAEGLVHGYTPSTGVCRVFCQTRVTGGFTLQEDGSLLLFQDGRLCIVGMDGAQRGVASNLCPENERFNDVIADPEGRVFAGAMGGNGRLLRFDPDGSITEMFDQLGIPNGMGFTPDLRGMYFTDSVPRRIYRFDYDRKTGNLTNRRIFAEISPDEGLPDGMAVDADGCVWTAIWFGGRLKRYAPDGRLDREVDLPVKQTSALAFGGPDLTDTFVTTATTTIADSLRPRGYDSTAPRGGSLYRVRIDGVQGRLPFRSRLRFP